MPGFGFGTPFAEQLDFFRNKLQLPSARWDDIERAAHDRAFIVAGAGQADLVNDLYQAMQQRIEDGRGLDAFRKDFMAIVQQHGWTGWTGEGSKAGEAWRTRVIYQTNMATSYAAGRYQQLTDPAFLALRPWWRYVHADNVMHPRPLHLLWGDMRLTLRYDDPFWDTHFPPNGWGCHCRVTPVAAPDDGDATAPPEGWDAINPKTGAQVGIDKGFDYAPGANAKTPLQDLLDQKLINLDAPVGAAMWETLAPVVASEREAAWLQWLADIAAAPDAHAKSLPFVVGAVAPEELVWLAAERGVAPATAEIAVNSGVINGPKAIRHSDAGDAIATQIWENLPAAIAAPLAVLFDNENGTLFYVLAEASSRRPALVVEFDVLRKYERVRNMIISGYRPEVAKLKERLAQGAKDPAKGLTLIRGEL